MNLYCVRPSLTGPETHTKGNGQVTNTFCINTTRPKVWLCPIWRSRNIVSLFVLYRWDVMRCAVSLNTRGLRPFTNFTNNKHLWMLRCAFVCSVSGICVFCMRVIVQMVASPLNLARGRAENNWRATKCWLNQHQQRSSSFQSNRMPRRFLHCIYIVFATKIRFFFCWNSLSCSLYLVWNLEREKICATSCISSIFICKGFRWYGFLVWCTL